MPKAFSPAVFQSFETQVDKAAIPHRVAALRRAIGAAGLDAFLVPRADAHRDESVPASEARLAYISGFTGSAGLALIGLKRAGLFVDSRYTLQAPAQTDTRLFRVFEAPPASLAGEIGRFVPRGGRIGYDPWLHTSGELRDLTAKLAGRAALVPVEKNLLDRIWADRPAPPRSPIEVLGDNRAGRSSAAKLDELRATLAAEDADAVVLTLPESICWLFNIRGRDTPNTPFVLGYAIVPRSGRPVLFLDGKRIEPALAGQLDAVTRLGDTKTLMKALNRLGAAGRRVLVDPQSAPEAVMAALAQAGAKLVEKRDPVLLPKSKKNEAEIGGMRVAHRLDGVALAKFLAWFDAEAPQGGLTEIDVVTALEAFRREDPSCVDASFDTIAGAGPDGAIVHYRVTTETNRRLAPGELMLIDSGAQYLAGTTDVTRTISTGPLTAEQKDRYTRVLKGMVGIATARFPGGTSGAQLDILARQHLWQAGVTYHHGTGHGVGAFLAVHEGPIGISPRYTTAFEPGMIVSDEPGYYKAGEYGIRTENLVMVVESAIGEGKFLEFETLTLAPIDTRPIEIALLTTAERDWLNAYHARVLKEIGPLVSSGVRSWLESATRPI
jgi:Xaa-Pro aminopeptidase